MREQLLDAMAHRDDLKVIDADFVHLFSSWFNRGFLVLRRIDWSTSAAILDKIIRYEAVHEIQDWDDLRRRIDPPDRRCYAFFHPALVDEPLIFVEVAQRATTAVFYSITNCQRGLAGVTFGHFLIKQVVEEVSRDLSRVATYVTLSPAPNFASWLKRERANAASQVLDDDDRAVLTQLDSEGWWRSPDIAEKIREPFLRAAAWYYVRARNSRGLPVDAVARFHLGNGARLERLDWLADTSERALKQSHGLMVNYLYDLDYIERNHEAYAQQRTIVAASSVTRLVTAPAREIVPVSG
jgi:malonyl-CoA decarboxylase